MTTNKPEVLEVYQMKHDTLEKMVLLADYEALQAECDALRDKTRLSLGVGDGSGNRFVYGDYDSIKRVQELIFENERMRTVLSQAREYVFEPDRDCKCKDCVDAASLLSVIDTALQKG